MSITIRIVEDQPCPKCGATPGHEDPKLDYPNRPKVTGPDNVSWWRCYNPDCIVNYYAPDTGEVEIETLTPKEAKELMARIDKMPIPDIEDIFGGD
jgi:hypothetical protein